LARCRRPWSGSWRPQLRYRAEDAGLTSVGLEEGQLVLRFGPDWSRGDTMRALAPRAVDDPLRDWPGASTTPPTTCACAHH
jgi:hypothetical protein